MRLPNEIKNKIAEMLVIKLAIPICALCILSWIIIPLFYPNESFRLLTSLPLFFLCLLSRISVWKQKEKLGGVFLIAAGIITVLTSMTIAGGIESPGYMGIVACLILVTCLHGTREAILVAAGMLGVGMLSMKLIASGLLPAAQPLPLSFLLARQAVLFTFVIIFISLLVNLTAEAIRESRAAAIERTDAKKELEKILDRTPDVIFKLDTKGVITFISKAVRKYGYREDQLVGQNLLRFLHPGDKADVIHTFRKQQTAEKAAHQFDIRIKSPENNSVDTVDHNGYPHSFLVRTEAIYSQNIRDEKTYTGIQGIARDVSEKKSYEKQLKQFAALIEQSEEEVVITDTNGIIQYVNPSFEKHTGYRKDEAIGMTPAILKSGLHDDAFYRDIWSTLLNKQIWKGVIKNKCKNGEIILHDTTITPILNSKNELSDFVSIRRDITEKEKIERQAQQTRKMETIGSLSAGIAHDFNNILAGILGYSELVQEDLESFEIPDSTIKKMDRVVTASLRAKDLVGQILAFSRSGREKPSPIVVKLIAKEVMQFLRASLPPTIKIESSILSDSCVMTDPTSIHQIFMNLCTNANDAMVKSGGTLYLILEDVLMDKKSVAMYDGVLPGKFLVITVRDTGFGMEKDVLDKIFDPFFTTKSMGDGTGMGLSVVYGIVKSMNGFIKANSSPGQGSQFDIFLPVCENEPVKNGRMDTEFKKLTGTENILFVDDEVTLTELARQSLGSYGYDVTIFTDSLAALEHFQSDPEKFDMVISDIIMPGMDGHLLIQKIRSIRPGLPAILCTGASEPMTEPNGPRFESFEVNALLSKPVPAEEMLLIIRSLLDKENNG